MFAVNTEEEENNKKNHLQQIGCACICLVGCGCPPFTSISIAILFVIRYENVINSVNMPT